MRILYVTDTLQLSGVARKSVTQAGEWERAGHQVWLATARHPQPRTLAQALAHIDDPLGHRSFFERARGELDYRVLFAPKLLAWARAHAIDLLYTREVPMAPQLPQLLGALPTVFEINGDALQELPTERQRVIRSHVRNYQLKHAAGVVFVSHELQRACAPAGLRRSIVIANPCRALDEQLAAAPRPRPERPTLVLIGSLRHPWTGFDKLVRMAELLPELDFVIIGAQLPGPANLRALPALPQAQADAVMRSCTVGVGSLALHRKQMEEASPLKSRNYLALGLPIIQAYRDTDLTEADGCVLQLPNVDDNVQPQLERIRAFVQRAWSEQGMSQRALELARGPLSLGDKERARLSFMQQCLGARR